MGDLRSNDVFNNLMNLSVGDLPSDVGSGRVERVDGAEKGEKVEKRDIRKLKPSERLLEGIKREGFNLDQLGIVLEAKGNLLIVSCAGSGKTTALVFKVCKDVVSGEAVRMVEVNGNVVTVPEKIWVGTFLKTGAEDLEKTMRMWIKKFSLSNFVDGVTFSTMHSEFYQSLTKLGMKPDIIGAKENTAILKKVCDNYQLRNEKGRPLNAENIRDLETALSYSRNRLDSERYNHQIYSNFKISPMLLDYILDEWKAGRVEKGKSDFDDLQEKLYDFCYVQENETVIGYLSNKYNYIYLDEFQDTSQIQYELLKVYGSGAKKIVAIGDDDQTIYSWRGSDNKIITEDFEKDFSPERLELSVNYRCPSNILNAVIPSIKNNMFRFDKSLKSFKDGGVLRIRESSGYSNMVKELYELVYQDVRDGKTVAILCRTNTDGLAPALMFDMKRGFKFSISGDGMTLNNYIGRLIMGIPRMFVERSSRDVSRALECLLWDNYEVKNLMNVCKSSGKSFWNMDYEDILYSCETIGELLVSWSKARRETQDDIGLLVEIFGYYVTDVFNSDSQFDITARSLIFALTSILEVTDYDSVYDFIADIEEVGERLEAKKGISSKVKIATVHEFKGKEADSVYIWNDSKSVFPYETKEGLNERELEEERRVHYIACTRAKEISTIMFQRGKAGLFLKEMDLEDAVELDSCLRDEKREKFDGFGSNIMGKLKSVGAVSEE